LVSVIGSFCGVHCQKKLSRFEPLSPPPPLLRACELFRRNETILHHRTNASCSVSRRVLQSQYFQRSGWDYVDGQLLCGHKNCNSPIAAQHTVSAKSYSSPVDTISETLLRFGEYRPPFRLQAKKFRWLDVRPPAFFAQELRFHLRRLRDMNAKITRFMIKKISCL
jgi:hypothetical protein